MAAFNELESGVRYLTERASDAYDKITFNTDDLYNEPAPDEWVSFMIGGIFSLLGCILWIYRYRKIKRKIGTDLHTWSVRIRVAITAFIDCDDPFYTCIKLAAQSFLFLGGLQYNYEVAFSVMLGWFGLESCCDSLRIFTAFQEVDSLKDLVVASSGIRSRLRNVSTQIRPSNVYEDLSRDRVIVFMVFVTQCVLIAFVVSDIYDTDTHRCHDGTDNCPVVGTLGSWAFYVLGIFMASVFLLGPKTAFGQSEQNPAFWLQLLISAKITGSKCTWYDPVTDQTITRDLAPSDIRLWLRFLMSFLINGVGFHILVHALPIQVAAQSSLTGVVFRAVGMMYLVDLDDTPGYTLTLVEKEEGEDEGKEAEAASAEQEPPSKGDIIVEGDARVFDGGELSAEAQQIIDNARAELDALAAGRGNAEQYQKANMTGALVMAGGMTQRSINITAASVGMVSRRLMMPEMATGTGAGEQAAETGGGAGAEDGGGAEDMGAEA